MDLKKLGLKLQKKFPKTKKLSPEVVAEKWLKMKAKKTTSEQIVKPIVKINGKNFTGESHGEAIDNAKMEGIDTSEVDREEDGKFMTSKGNILDRKQAKKRFGISHSHEIGTDRKFIVVTKDFSGLGFAVQELARGTEVVMAYKLADSIDEDEIDAYMKVGEGMVEKYQLDDLMDKRDSLKDCYWIWDGNHNFQEGEMLRGEGFKVFGGTEFTFQLENDREFGAKFAESCGLVSPPTFEFTSPEEGLSFLEEHEETAYVFKPNETDDNSLTYVPMSEDPMHANKEVQRLIEAYRTNPATSSYILQEKVQGVEVNVEAFFINGVPYFAHANFEDKFNHQKDTGEATGCAFDVDFEIIDFNYIYDGFYDNIAPRLSDELRARLFQIGRAHV